MQHSFRSPLLLTTCAAVPALAQDGAAPLANVLEKVQPVFASPNLNLEKFTGQTGAGVPKFAVRPGYKVTLAAENFGQARFLEFDDKGTLYVSQPNGKSITSLRDGDGDGVYETKAVFVKDLPQVHGLAFANGWLWFTQTGAVYKARDTNGDGVADETVPVIPQGKLPEKGGHWWRSIAVGENGFWTSIGDSSNLSDELNNSERQKVWFFDLEGKNKKLWSSGLRNTEKLRLRPGTGEVWGLDHGSDDVGAAWGETKGKLQPFTDAYPPEEFNNYSEGAFYGHPFILGNRFPHPQFLTRPDLAQIASKTTSPAWCFGAHWSGNGFTFLTKDYFPGHKGDAFLAFRGSNNSTNKVGYRIERLMFDQLLGRPVGSQLIVSTIDAKGAQLDRPVDCVEAPNGTVLFSADSGKVFRISKAE